MLAFGLLSAAEVIMSYPLRVVHNSRSRQRFNGSFVTCRYFGTDGYQCPTMHVADGRNPNTSTLVITRGAAGQTGHGCMITHNIRTLDRLNGVSNEIRLS